MIKALKKIGIENHSGISGDLSGIGGDLSGIRGDLSGIWGDVSGIRGNVDDCKITATERETGINIDDLIQPSTPTV